MELVDYLSRYFLTTQQLVEGSKVSTNELADYQDRGIMPRPSYQLKMTIDANSFFGKHTEQHAIEYYPKGYLSWLGLLQINHTPQSVYQIFCKRYQSTIAELKTQGHCTNDPKLGNQLDNHIKDEWQHFLDGTYGLCTRSGLPEDIAAKEFAISQINELTSLEILDDKQLKQLNSAVGLLDSASALFAPHEREKSSRQRLINDVRREYKL